MAAEYPAPKHPLPENPCGWFAVGLAHELRNCEVKVVSAFGQNLVLFRTAAGKISLLDAYCPHMGTHLGQGGTVDGECLRCPFHRWGFGPDGACTDIPYAGKVPPQARVRAYPVIERNGALLAWFHPRGAPPSFEIPEFSTSGWSEHTWLELVLPVHIQEVAENGIDVAHFLPIHRSQRSRATIIDAKNTPFRFQLETAYEGDGIGAPGEYVKVTTTWSYYGMGMFCGVTRADDFNTEVRHLFHFTPVPGGHLHFRCAVGVNLQTLDESLVEMVMEKNAEITIRNLQEDAPIWKHKRYLTRPVLCDGDEPYVQLRQWSRQFFIADAESAPMIVEGELPAGASPGANEVSFNEASAEPAAPAAESKQSHSSSFPPFQPSQEPATASVGTVDGNSAEGIAHIFFEKMSREFNPTAVDRDFVVQYEIGGEAGGSFVVEVRNKQYHVTRGTHATPTVRVSIQATDWSGMHSGKLGSARAFLTGKLKVVGDMKLARKLASIFPITT